MKKLFYLLLCLPLAFAACNETEEPQPQPQPEPEKKPTLTLTSDTTMEFEAAGGDGVITYTLENAVEGTNLEATCEADWVLNLTTGETVTFAVAENETEEARETKVKVAYGELSFDVTVKQAGKKETPKAPVFELVSEEVMEFSQEQELGSIEYKLENAVEGVELQATADVEWITITSAADGIVAFTVAANETEKMRGGIITLTYGEVSLDVTIEQLFEGYDPNMNYAVFSVIETWADSKNGGKQWNVTFVEKVDLMGECQTVISFYMEEGNAQRIVDGTYSVANGGILVNSASQNGFSVYRGNSSLATDIVDATFEVVADTDNHTISIVGTFQSGNDIIALSYDGTIRGMDISEPTTEAINITDWKQFTGKYWNGYNDDSEFMFQGKSSDNTVEFMFDCYAYPRVSDKIAPEGTYTIAPWEAKDNYQGDTLIIMDQSYIIYNTIKGNLAEGTLTVTHMRGQYYIEFDFIDTLGRHFTGSYTGQLTTGSTMNNPA